MYNIDELLAEAAKKLDVLVEDIEWYSWPQVFANTSGPHKKPSGQALTSFQVFGFNANNGNKIKTCDGLWQSWNGSFIDQWK